MCKACEVFKGPGLVRRLKKRKLKDVYRRKKDEVGMGCIYTVGGLGA